MTVTIELSTEEERKLLENATLTGLALSEYVRSMIGGVSESNGLPKTGAELVAAIDALNLSGEFGDPNIDSPKYARMLRHAYQPSYPR